MNFSIPYHEFMGPNPHDSSPPIRTHNPPKLEVLLEGAE